MSRNASFFIVLTRGSDPKRARNSGSEPHGPFEAVFVRFKTRKGRLPLLTWFSEEGEDTFRFAHLTFQEPRVPVSGRSLERCEELVEASKARKTS